MRLTVALMLNLMANGMPDAEILAQYPDLEPEDLNECRRYAAWLADERVWCRTEALGAVPG